MVGSLSLRIVVGSALALALSLVIAPVAPEYYLHLANNLIIFAVLALGLDLLMGWAGQFALAHPAFFAIGCYGTALLNLKLGVPFVIAMPVSAVLAGLLGLLVGIPATRMRNIYLSLATFAFAESMRWVLNSWDSLTGGPNGIRISPFNLFGYGIINDIDAFPVIVLLFLMILAATIYLTTSRFSREMLAIRESEHVALASGVDVTQVKLKVFAISAVYAGLAGGMFALTHSFTNPDQFGFATSIVVLSMIVVGGMGSIAGVLIGVVIIGLLPEVLRGALKSIQIWQELIYGVILIAAMMFAPKGVWGVLRELWLKTSRTTGDLGKPAGQFEQDGANP